MALYLTSRKEQQKMQKNMQVIKSIGTVKKSLNVHVRMKLGTFERRPLYHLLS